MNKYPIKHLSNSSLKQWNTCAFAWKKKYVDHVKQPNTFYFAFGRAVHAALEEYGRMVIMREEIDREKIFETYQQEALKESVGLPSRDLMQFRADYPMGHDLVEATLNFLDGKPIVNVEEEFLVDLGWGIPFKGFFDVVFDDPKISDYKTTSKPWPKKKLNEDTQFTIYYAAYHQLYGVYPKLSVIQLNKKTKETTETFVLRTPLQIEKVKQMVQEMLAELETGIYKKCGRCEMCRLF